MNRDSLLLGIDVGTTQIKVGAFHLDGRLAALAAADYPLAFDATTYAAEQDPTDWWAATVRTIKQVLAEVDATRLLALSVGGQGPTVVGVDRDLNPVGPALTWLDRRAGGELQQLSERTSRVLPPHAFVPKVMWLATHRPGIYAATHHYCQSWDFVAARLSGELAVSMSPSIAPWDDELLTVSQLDRARFPRLHPMASPLGRVTSEAARLTGLPAGLPIVGGISDYFESLIGAGALQPGLACDNGGTSESLNVCWDAALKVEGAFCIPSFTNGYWYLGGPASTTGKALEWWREQILDQARDDWQILPEAEAIPPGSDNLIFLPYLAGERAPLWDPDARGVFFGLSLNHRRAHLTRAILEAVAYTLCHLIETVEAAGAQVREIRVCGGQARSELWCQIKADATGRRVVVPEVSEVAVLGAAIIAGVGIGLFDAYAAGAAQMVRRRTVLEPNEAYYKRYRALYAVYRDLYPALRPLYERLRHIDDGSAGSFQTD